MLCTAEHIVCAQFSQLLLGAGSHNDAPLDVAGGSGGRLLHAFLSLHRSNGLLSSVLCAMQTKQGDPAKDITAEEFIEFMKRARAAFYRTASSGVAAWRWRTGLGLPLAGAARQRFELIKKAGRQWKSMPDWDSIFSFDHPNIHGGRQGTLVLQALGLKEEDHFPLPGNSPDMHRVIERTHARLVQQFELWYYSDHTRYPSKTYKEHLENLFYYCPEVAGHEALMKDVCALHEAFAEIVRRKGARLPKPWS